MCACTKICHSARVPLAWVHIHARACVPGPKNSCPFHPFKQHTHVNTEGSLYVMHNEAVTYLDHAVSAPHASFKVCSIQDKTENQQGDRDVHV
jgi:hypothetical protein